MAKSAALVDQQATGSNGAPNAALDRLKTGPGRLGEFLKDVRAEMHKVITPSRPEVQNTTVVVIATVFVFALFFAIIDYIVGHGVTFIFDHLARP